MNQKERPIIFSTPMVKAILDGRKTMTRRIVKPQPPIPDNGEFIKNGQWKGAWKCSYGKVGDLLWVRETWADISRKFYSEPHSYFAYKASSCRCGHKCACIDVCKTGDSTFKEHWCFYHDKWKPSKVMPRWASRITLEITNIRVERLQDISNDDAKAEGCDDGEIITQLDVAHIKEKCGENSVEAKLMEKFKGGYFTAKSEFINLWRKINGAESWNQNPWVWVIEFKRSEVNK